MFTRLRYAAGVLSRSVTSPYEEPGVTFEEERREANVASEKVGSLIGILIISLAVGVIGAPLLARIVPAKTMTSVTVVTSVIAALLAIALDHLRAWATARLGETVAPYFGHRITRAIRLIRG
jgi:hypothetical protein